ncbi:MAG: HDIG domain-containing protein [Bacteroidales bacterium]
MKRIVHGILRNISLIYKVFLFVISVLLIVYLFPRQVSFKYEFTQGRPWLDDDLIAPFDFAIQKSEEELKKERNEILSDFLPFFSYNYLIYNNLINSIELEFEKKWQEKYGEQPSDYSKKLHNKNTLISLFDSVYSGGVIFVEEAFKRHYSGDDIRLIDGQVAEKRSLDEFYDISDAYNFMRDKLDDNNGRLDKELLTGIIENSLVYNVFYNEELTLKARNEAIDNISPNRGMVQQGEKIISRGELITEEKYRILDSFRAEYNRQIGDSTGNVLLFLGQLILVSIPIIVLVLFLKTFRRDVFADNRKIILILLTVFMMVFFTSLVLKYDINLLYIVPVAIVPILMRAFFDNRLALYVHIIAIILIGFLVPRSFEFVFIQFIAGIIAILSLVSMRKRSQLFIAVGWIILSYSAVYFGLNMVQGVSPEEMDFMVYARFGISGLLTLFAYPLIYFFERLFKLPTDFSLLELSDINSPLLRELSLKAPGTFQHSLQVANLAEEAIFAIGGKSLLIRTGALYHDIGKMDAPLFFTENQHSEHNPHDELSNEESAAIIIGHVMNGVEKARKHNIPEYIIDFIRTHHGTMKVKYFYTMEVNENPDKEISAEKFSYNGTRPFSKETAVMMMADSVEAASRSLNNPDEDAINSMVENIIDAQMEEKQFEQANITFRDISMIKEIFKRRLLNIFHVRISYPTINN